MTEDDRKKLCEEVAMDVVRNIWEHRKVAGTHGLDSHGASDLQSQVYEYLLKHIDFKPNAKPEDRGWGRGLWAEKRIEEGETEKFLAWFFESRLFAILS